MIILKLALSRIPLTIIKKLWSLGDSLIGKVLPCEHEALSLISIQRIKEN